MHKRVYASAGVEDELAGGLSGESDKLGKVCAERVRITLGLSRGWSNARLPQRLLRSSDPCAYRDSSAIKQ
jgi:hypothetical protein